MAGAAEAWRLVGAGLGLATAAGGLVWAAWAAWCLVRAPAPLTEAGPARVMIDHGPFAFGRHPIYLGAAVALLGLGVALASPAWTVAALLGFAAIDRWLVPAEEAQLRRRYGGWYSDYAAEVPRWF
jgi:protein-S-isoprenylcysteine O-methyltransferase Ste14